ncbi:MAG: hypothetical protein ACRDV2_00260, partial [Actinomycetes bacterium]
SGVPTECSGNINVAESNSDLICAAGEQAMEDEIGSSPVASSGCLTGTVDGNGTLCVTYTGCTVEGWTVHDGSFGQVTHCAYFANGVVVGQPNGVGYSVTDNGTTICFSKL